MLPDLRCGAFDSFMMAFSEIPAQNLTQEKGTLQVYQKSREAPTYRIALSQLLGLQLRVQPWTPRTMPFLYPEIFARSFALSLQGGSLSA